MSKRSTNLYQALPFPIGVRTPLLPMKAICDVYAADNPIQTLRALMEATPLVRQAIFVASPGLDEAIEHWCEAGSDARTNVPLRALAYLARMTGRTTPLGIFAGVGVIEAGPKTNLKIDAGSRRTRTRADMSLVGEMIKSVEAAEGTREYVRYQCNEAAFSRGERLYVANTLLVNQRYGRADQRPVTLRETEVVRFVREFASTPQTFRGIADQLASRFREPMPEVERVLGALIEAGVLISELRASPVGDPNAQILKRMSELETSLALPVSEAATKAESLDRRPVGERTLHAYKEVFGAYSSLVADHPQLSVQVDMHAPCKGNISSYVLADACLLGEYLVRMGSDRSLKAFRARFIERYGGKERMVPILELVDDNVGLGNVDDLGAPEATSPERDALLSRIACDTIRSNADEFEISAEELEVIAPPLPQGTRIPPMELCFQVAAQSTGAIEEGDYRVVPSGFAAALGTGRSLGRFLGFLGDRTRAALLNALEDTDSEAIRAEFVFAPPRDRSYNVLVRPRVLEREIQVGVVDSTDVERINLSDLWVGIEDDRFFLWSKRYGRRIDPVESHLFSTQRLAPNLCRLISLIGHDGVRVPGGFPWGSLATLTMLPRIRYGRVVLSLKQWMFTPDQLGILADDPQGALRGLMDAWAVPRYVFLVDGDNRLALDLDSKIAADLLSDRLKKGAPQRVILQEMLPAPDEMWLCDSSSQGYASEFVISLTSEGGRTRQSSNDRTPSILSSRCAFGPGSDWLYIKAYVGRQAADELLTCAIAPIVARCRSAETISGWFFIRYADPQDHVRLRFRLASGAVGARDTILAEMERMLRDGRIVKYAIDTYEPEYERYGGADAIDAVERVFEMDSDWCIDYLRRREHSTDGRIALAAESFFPWVLTADELQDQFIHGFADIARRKMDAPDRAVLKNFVVGNMPRAAVGLAAALAGSDPLHRLRAIFHMHCNRFGLDALAERRTASLVRATLISWRASSAQRRAPDTQRPLQTSIA